SNASNGCGSPGNAGALGCGLFARAGSVASVAAFGTTWAGRRSAAPNGARNSSALVGAGGTESELRRGNGAGRFDRRVGAIILFTGAITGSALRAAGSA